METNTARKILVEKVATQEPDWAADMILVRQIAASLARRLPSFVDFEELISLGHLGLVEARRRYDGRRGVPFGAFAQLRIRGAILDGLRDEDTATREERARIRRQEADGPAAVEVSLEAAAHAAAPDTAADARVEHRQELAQLAGALNVLTERQRAVIEAHFFAEEPLKSIGVRLGVTESRVCQIVGEALTRLRHAMKEAA